MKHVCKCGRTTERRGKCEICNKAESRPTNRAKNQRRTVREVYATTRWKRLRPQILRRDNNICQVCGRHAETVGHIIPFTSGDDPNAWYRGNLRAECLRCNGREAGKRSHAA